MSVSSSLTRTATIALAIAALVAPTASARPADMPAAVTKATAAAQQKQNLRSPDAIDAATRPALGSQANPRLDAAPQATADRGIAWATIGIGVAASLLAIGAITGVARRTRRSGRARITA